MAGVYGVPGREQPVAQFRAPHGILHGKRLSDKPGRNSKSKANTKAERKPESARFEEPLLFFRVFVLSGFRVCFLLFVITPQPSNPAVRA